MSKIGDTTEKAKQIIALLTGCDYAEFVVCDDDKGGWLEIDGVEFQFNNDMKITETKIPL